MTDTIEHTGESVAAWLRLQPRTTAEPVTVKIGRDTFVGAEFRQVRDHSPGTRAYAEGKRTYVMHALYLVGERPSSYMQNRAHAYLTPSGERWYVSSWWTPADYGEDGIRKGGAVAYVRMPDGSTRPQTFDDVRVYHYGAGDVAHFQMSIADAAATLPDGYRRTVDKTMPITIERS